jgi:hypothetical protein
MNVCGLVRSLGVVGVVCSIASVPAAGAPSDDMGRFRALQERVTQLSQQGRYDEAVDAEEEALVVCMAVLGRDHPTCNAESNRLALLFGAQRRANERPPSAGKNAADITEQVFICQSDRKHPEVITIIPNRKLVRIESKTNNTELPCVTTYVDGLYGPTYSGSTAGYCSVFTGNESQHQVVKFDSRQVSFGTYGSAGDRAILTLDFNSGIVRGPNGSIAGECHRTHS